MSIDLGELYAASRNRITDLVMSSPAEAPEWPCPATPEWSVHDLVAHLRGVAEDVRSGNVAAAGTDPWTAEQVARHQGRDTTVLLSEWTDDAATLEAFLSSPAGEAASRAVIDVYTHEVDLRGALGRPADLNGTFADWLMTQQIADHLFETLPENGVAPMRIVTREGDELGPSDTAVVLRLARFELFRAMLGRRSPAQVSAYDWGGANPSPYLEHFFIFGPRETALDT